MTHMRPPPTPRSFATDKSHLISAIDDRLHSGMEIVGMAASSAPAAVHVVTHVDVPPPKKDDCIAALKALAAESRKDRA